MKQHIIVFIGKAPWNSPPARHKHLAVALSEFYDILYLEDGGTVVPIVFQVSRNIYVGRGFLKWFDKFFRCSKLSYSFVPSMLLNLYCLVYRTVIVWDMENCHKLLPGVRASLRIFDHIDPCFSELSDDVDQFDKRVEDLCQHADIVFATSHLLHQDCLRHNRDARLLPNAANEDLHSDIEQERDIDLIYSGSLDQRLDYVFLSSLLSSDHYIKIVFVGRCSELALRNLGNHHRVEFVGELNEHETNVLLRRSKYGIIPYLQNSNSDRLNPVKLFHYIACGVIPLCLPTFELDMYSEYCLVLSEPEEWLEALSNGIVPSRWNERLDFVHNNTWAKRAASADAVIQSLMQYR